MITLTALTVLLGLGWLVRQLWKRATSAARKLVDAEPAASAHIPARAP